MGSQRGTSELSGPFRGSEALAAGLMTRKQLAGARYRRMFRDVYVPIAAALTHELRCECAALVLPADAVITGRSAATLRGIQLALTGDPVEALVGLQTRLFRRAGVDLRRCEVRADEAQPWSRIRLATRRRTAFDLLLDRALPDAVADLDAMLRAALVGRTEMELYLAGRHDRGIVAARRAVELADPRAQSRPESRLRVHLVLDGLSPEVQFPVHHAGQWVATVDSAFPCLAAHSARRRIRRGVARRTAAGRRGPGATQPTARRGLGSRLRHAGAPPRTPPDDLHSPGRAAGTPCRLAGLEGA